MTYKDTKMTFIIYKFKKEYNEFKYILHTI